MTATNRVSPADSARSLAELRAAFAEPTTETAPMMRWWWFGPQVERTELDRELTAMAAAGLGGVEVACVYPFVGDSDTYLSLDFLERLRFAADRAAELGLRFDLTLGSGWSFGGPHIGPEHAARQLHWDRREIGPGGLEIPVRASWPGDELIAAYLGPGSLQEPPDELSLLSVTGEMIIVPPGAGVRQILLAWSRLTGQNVKRAAVGAEGPVLDHYSAEAVRRHLSEVAEPLLDAVPGHLLGSVFCDSLEVYGSDWTAALVEEFAERRGYDLVPDLYRMVLEDPIGAEPEAIRVRADVGRTLAELYEQNFVTQFQAWAAERGVPFRIQSYGTPPALISSYRHADLIEGEGWGWTELTQTRWASSAAHLYGAQVVSSEVWTWVHSPSFRATPADLKGEAHEHLLAGINQFVGHGWPYSPVDAPGVGWIFYAAAALDDRNPWWPAMAPLARYLARLSGLMRQGTAVTDVLVYISDDDVLSRMGTAIGGTLDPWREARKMVDPEVLRMLRQGGWDYDLVDDVGLSALPEDESRPVIMSGSRALAPAARAWFERYLAGGRPVIAVQAPVSLSGAVASTAAQLPAVLTDRGVAGIRLDPPQSDIGVVRRRIGEIDVCLVINTGPFVREFSVGPASMHPDYERWDADLGRAVSSGPVAAGIAVRLEPYQATVIVLSDQVVLIPQVDHGPDLDHGQTHRLDLSAGWSVDTSDGRADVSLPHVWEDDPRRPLTSTSARYGISVELSQVDSTASTVLDLGDCSAALPGEADAAGMRGHSYRVEVEPPVGVVAEIVVNGVDCGLAWAPPYRVDVSRAVRSGDNLIEIIVHGSAAHALALDPGLLDIAQATEQRHGRRARLQDLDRATDGVRSGLLAIPALLITTDQHD